MSRRARFLSPVAEFLRTEAGGGVLLLAAGTWAVREDLQHWVNDALMAVFFFLIGLEIKRELVVGELRDPRAASLPVLDAGVALGSGALGGVTKAGLRASAGRLPSGVGMGQVLGGGALGGIGFTVSLFIAGLAFTSSALQSQAKIGILAGSLLAALVGVALLLRERPTAPEAEVSSPDQATVM